MWPDGIQFSNYGARLCEGLPDGFRHAHKRGAKEDHVLGLYRHLPDASVLGREQKQAPSNAEIETNSAAASQTAPVGRALIVQVTPLALIVAVWGAIYFLWIPFLQRRMYRRDQNLHGISTVTLDTKSFVSASTTGASFQCPWSVFHSWHEKQGIVLLRYPNGTFAILNIAGLSDMDQRELREILAEVLPTKS